MPTQVATHSGPFHADDVMAVALIRVFLDADATVVRTRDLERIAAADIAVDVGGAFDPATGRFDHHQASYTGTRSSAGLVLDHLEALGRVEPALAAHLRAGAMDYLDDVDTGRVAPRAAVPCLPRIVDALGQGCETDATLDAAFEQAARFSEAFVRGTVTGWELAKAAEAVVRRAMDAAVARGSNLLELDAYVAWKVPYFALGGATHPTEYVVFPGTDGSWRVIAAPPELGSFATKRPFPEAWAGLVDDALSAVAGVPDARFCHKNRFIAVFGSKDGAVRALRRAGLLTEGA